MAALLALGAAGFCGGEKNYTADMKGGVRFVHNRGPAAGEPGARLEFVRRIGETEAEDDDLMFVSPIHLAEDVGGNIYVLDSQDCCVKKFDKDGAFLLKFGRRGQGPGEFQFPMRIISDGGNRLVVSGFADHQIFDLDGRFVGRFTLSQYEGMFMEAVKPDLLVGFSFSVGGENNKRNTILKTFDGEGKTVHAFGEPLLMARTQDTWNANFLDLAVDGEGNIYAAFLWQNRIEKYSPDGRLLMNIDREVPYRVEHRVVRESMEIGGRVRQVEQLRSTAVARNIGLDGQGRLWVLGVIKQPSADIKRDEYVPHEYTRFEVYNPDGVLLFHVPMPEELASFDNVVQAGDDLYFLDPFGECCVHHYRIVHDQRP